MTDDTADLTDAMGDVVEALRTNTTALGDMFDELRRVVDEIYALRIATINLKDGSRP